MEYKQHHPAWSSTRRGDTPWSSPIYLLAG